MFARKFCVRPCPWASRSERCITVALSLLLCCFAYGQHYKCSEYETIIVITFMEVLIKGIIYNDILSVQFPARKINGIISAFFAHWPWVINPLIRRHVTGTQSWILSWIVYLIPPFQTLSSLFLPNYIQFI